METEDLIVDTIILKDKNKIVPITKPTTAEEARNDPTLDVNYQYSQAAQYNRFFRMEYGNQSDYVPSLRTEFQRMRRGLPYDFHPDIFTLNKKRTLYQRDLKEHCGCVNTVEFSRDENLFASAGDDRRVVVWRTLDALSTPRPGQHRIQPLTVMKRKHLANIFSVKFNHDGTRVLSAGNDEYFHVHDIETNTVVHSRHASVFYSLSVHHGNDNIVAAATEHHRVYLYDLRTSPSEAITGYSLEGENFSVDFNHRSFDHLATCNRRLGLGVLDIRATKNYYVSAGPVTIDACYSSWNASGDGIFCIRSGRLPIYYNLKRSLPIGCQDSEYRHNVTIKSCQMIGNNYAITGSDKWDIYCWKIPHDYLDRPGPHVVEHEMTAEAYTKFSGHQSIVNHVRYSEKNNIMVSCGVEKTIKIWSPHEIPDSYRNPEIRQPYPPNAHFEQLPNDVLEPEREPNHNTLSVFDNYVRREDSGPYIFHDHLYHPSTIPRRQPPITIEVETPNNRYESNSSASSVIAEDEVIGEAHDLMGVYDLRRSPQDDPYRRFNSPVDRSPDTSPDERVDDSYLSE